MYVASRFLTTLTLVFGQESPAMTITKLADGVTVINDSFGVEYFLCSQFSTILTSI